MAPHNIPVLAPLTTETHLDLVVKPDGTLWLFYDTKFQLKPEWLEFDENDKAIILVGPAGEMQDCGLTIPPRMVECLRNSKTINLGYVVGDKIQDQNELSIVIRTA